MKTLKELFDEMKQTNVLNKYFNNENFFELNEKEIISTIKIKNLINNPLKLYNKNGFELLDTIIDFEKSLIITPFFISYLFNYDYSSKNGEFIWENIENIRYEFMKKNENIQNYSFQLEFNDHKLNLYYKQIN
jgi:hypothetical protein